MVSIKTEFTMRRIIPYFLFCFIFIGIVIPEDVRSQHDQQSYQEIFQSGLDLFEKGLYLESASLFEKAAVESQSSTDRETADFYRVRAYTQIDSAATDLYADRFIQEYPGSNRVAVLLKEIAHQHLERGEYREAIDRFDQALNYPQSYTDRAELYYTLGEVSAESGDYELARRYFLELSDNHQRSIWSPRALYSRGRLYLEEESYDSASDAFELLRERHPDTAPARRIGTALGESYYQQKRYPEAIEAFLDAINYVDEENRQKAIYLIAESYNAINNFEEATRYYRIYLSRVDNPAEERIAHYGLGWVYHKQDIYHWASTAFAEASNDRDDLARRALYYQAVNEKLAGRFRNSLDTFREFGDRFDEGVFYEEARYEWAFTALEVGSNSEAVEVLLPLARNYTELNDPGSILILLGEAYYANGEYTRAIEAFELAGNITDLDPVLKRQTQFQRAWVLYFNQAYRQAQPDFEAVYNAAPSSDLGSEALFWSADANYQSAEFGAASRQFAEFIRQYPNSELVGAAKYSLGWSYFMMGDFENATSPLIDFLNNYEPPTIALFPYDIDTRLRIADSFYAQGKYGEAMEYYRATIGAEPGGDYAMFQVANSHYRMDRNFEAVTEFRRLLRIYPFSRLREQAAYNIAYIYLNTGNYDQAIEEFRSVISRYPGTEWAARAQYNIGDSYYNSGNFEAAIDAYRQVLEDYPRSQYIIEAIDGIQFAQMSAGMDDTSTNALEDFLDENPTSTTADRLRFRQAENVFQAGDYNGAVSEFRQYLRITNNRELMPEAYFNLGDAYMRTGRISEAAETFETLINDFPNSERAAPALAQLARIQLELGNYEESKRRYSELGELDSRYQQEALLGIGNANLELGERAEARQNFENVLAINPDSDIARVGLGEVLLRDGRVEEARRFFNLVVENNSTEIGAEAQFLAGETYLAEENNEAAIEAFTKLNTLFEAYGDWVSEAQLKIAEIYIREGRRGEAISILNSIIDRYPDSPGAVRAERLLRGN